MQAAWPLCRPLAAARPGSAQARRRDGGAVAGATRRSGGFGEFIAGLQHDIIQEAQRLDGSSQTFLRDSWDRSSSVSRGSGVTAVLEDGALLEKAAVNITEVEGVLSPERAAAMSTRGRMIDPGGGQRYGAAALSLVFHPRSPFVPTLRADVRRFQVEDAAWFGGGCDLTPAYIVDGDASAFHGFWKAVCNQCDDYFYLPARKEYRGVGGIFFDDLVAGECGFNAEAVSHSVQFVRDVGAGILASWAPISTKNRGTPVSDANRQWQLLRRGRYLEFNLLYDRGVRFGLDGGRVESVMVSAPPLAAWRYNVKPQSGSPEAATLDVLRMPRDWA